MSDKLNITTDGLEADFADEFASIFGGAGEAIARARGEDEDDDGTEATGSDLVNEVLAEADDSKPKVAAGDAAVTKEPALAYSEDDVRALDGILNPKVEDRPNQADPIRLLMEQNHRLERLLAGQGEPRQTKPRLQPTGDPEVDAVLNEAGILDTTPRMPPEFESRLQQLERRNAELEQSARMNQQAAAMAAAARAKAEAITRVFKDVDVDALAQVIVAGGDGLEFARRVYEKAGILGQDRLPSRHLSDLRSRPMPHTHGVQNARGARKSTSNMGWTPTDNIAERERRLAGRG